MLAYVTLTMGILRKDLAFTLAYLRRVWFWSFKMFKSLYIFSLRQMYAIILFVAQSCTHRRPQSLGANYIFENGEFESLGWRWWCMILGTDILNDPETELMWHTVAHSLVSGRKDICRCSLLDLLITDEIISEEMECTWKHLKTHVHFKVQKNCTTSKFCRFIRSHRRWRPKHETMISNFTDWMNDKDPQFIQNKCPCWTYSKMCFYLLPQKPDGGLKRTS